MKGRQVNCSSRHCGHVRLRCILSLWQVNYRHTATLRIRHVALAACECESVELFVGFVLHVLACQTFGSLMSAAGQLPFPTPLSPYLLCFVSNLLQLLGCHSKLSRKRKLLCKHFAAPSRARARGKRGVYVTPKSSEVGLAYVASSCHPFHVIFLRRSGHLATLPWPGQALYGHKQSEI